MRIATFLLLTVLRLAQCSAEASTFAFAFVDEVDPFIGSVTSHPSSPAHGLGKTIPGPCTPYGLVLLGPDTIIGGDNGSGYSYSHKTIEGFTFTAQNAGDPAALYIQSAKLNGRPFDRAWLTHDEITAGGTLAFTLGREPNRAWGLVPPPTAFGQARGK